MNLYKSFGNLMEVLVHEDQTYTKWHGNNSEKTFVPCSDMETNLRSESVDSGVETASCYSPHPATSCSVSTDTAEMDIFLPQMNGPTMASTSQSPVLASPMPSSASSSSPPLCRSRAEEVSSTLHQKVEQALQRTNTKHLTLSREALIRHPRPSSLPKWHTIDIVRCQRSGSCSSRRDNSSVAIRQTSERRPLSVECYKQRSEDCDVQERQELSPGLCYLEQVCQMLEEIARQQMQNQRLQMETDALLENKDIQSDSAAVEKEPSPCNRLEHPEDSENISNKPKQQKYQHFRRRSVSDTTVAMLHSRKLNGNCRGQQLSTNDLLEMVVEDYKMEDLTKKEPNKIKNWRLKVGSLRRRDEYAASDTKGQQMQSSEKNSLSRRLSQLFRRRKTALPV
ncbi:uncharacterized protein si:dkey-106l3.7 [Cololabis saira]|uniref:uncharacterized protein si:dkey-106l3.7 n=1 Tax=Cololabis saira TaxID=129043 RepID=UPI002AD54919|nr:uncharacterized protein si:dkey-106l3.7 [Cololabis saira]